MERTLAIEALLWQISDVRLTLSLSVVLPFQAFVISFTSDFIPRLVYQYMFSETGTMHGFIDHTLSHFNVSNFKPGTAPQSSEHGNITVCR